MIVKVSRLALFANSPPIAEAEFANDSLSIAPRGNGEDRHIEGESIKEVTTSAQLLHARLTVLTHNGQKHSIGGLNKGESKALKTLIQKSVDHHRGIARQRAKGLSATIIETETKAGLLLSPTHYLRHSSTSEAVRKTVSATAVHHGFAEEFISPQARTSLAHIRQMLEPEGLEPERQVANHAFLGDEVARVKAVSQDVSRYGLTDEQAKAVATEEDVTLVLAGAGTGKTVVITAKIAQLVRNQGVPLEKILVLAFNRDAAQEIRDRLPLDLQGANVLTFHAFGLQVIASQDVAPTISTMASDSFALAKAMEGFLTDLMNDPEVGNVAIRFMVNMPADYKAPFDFGNEGEYQRYIREVELRALSGHLVKSFEELEIANWLTQNGIPFWYERIYPEETRRRDYRQYQPDFWIPGKDIYIEHFALNENSAAPPGWTGYAEGVQWKRQKHQEKGTTLIETYSWQHRQESLLPTLRQKLLDAGVEFKPISREQLVAKLGKERISPFCGLLCAFLNHAKSGNLPHEELVRRIDDAGDRKRAEAFLQVFDKARQRYEARLSDEQALDFHDLINQAVTHLKDGAAGHDYSHVLVDEFQDISSGRMELLKALRRPDMAYFLVGDDWQSIYRFTGSRVSLVRNVAQHLGHTRVETLNQTFRFGRKILEPSSCFIQQNPEQTRRTLQPNPNVNDKGLTVVATRDPADGLRAVIKDLAESADYEENDTIMVLGRFRHSRRALHTQGPRARKKVVYRTVHSAKGQEADYVVTLDLKDSKHGFPCKVEDDPLLKLVLPPVEDGEYKFAEERRLFYVALTRAKKGAYLVVDERLPSPFVRELLENPNQEIRLINKLMPPCPRCLDGTLRESRSGANLRCSNHPDCRYLAPLCPKCKEGLMTTDTQETQVCSNPSCREKQQTCPACRQGILLQRRRKRDNRPFLGCSRFTDDPPCKYVRR